MKKLVLASALLVSSAVHAYGVDFPSMQFPTKAGWAVAMVSQACDIPLRELKSAKGQISKTSKGQVLYTVYMNGGVYAQATASSTSLFAKKTCK